MAGRQGKENNLLPSECNPSTPVSHQYALSACLCGELRKYSMHCQKPQRGHPGSLQDRVSAAGAACHKQVGPSVLGNRTKLLAVPCSLLMAVSFLQFLTTIHWCCQKLASFCCVNGFVCVYAGADGAAYFAAQPGCPVCWWCGC